MMTEEQRYLFDLCGYLHLSNALTPEDLDAASQAAGRYIDYRLPRLRRTPAPHRRPRRARVDPALSARSRAADPTPAA